MKVMITGATGFIGGHLLKAVADAGHQVTALVRSEGKLATVCSIHGIDRSTVTAVAGDILDAESVRAALAGADACIHGAAFTTLDPAEMPKALDINAPGARIVLDAAVAAGCDPIIHLSSMSVIFPPTGDKLSAYDPTQYSGAPYTDSKVDADLHARALQDAGHPVVITYPAGVTGPTEVGYNVMSMMLATILGAPYVMTTDSGGYLLIDVRDVAAGTAAMLKPGLGARRYVQGGHFITWDGFAHLVHELTGVERQIAHTSPDVLEQTLDKEAVDIMLGCVPGDDAPTIRDTGVSWRPLADTIVDTTRWLVGQGHLDAQWAGKIVPPPVPGAIAGAIPPNSGQEPA